jgi:hypothetical protein
MKNLEKTLVENLMRFYPKNLDPNLLKKFLTEQDDYIRRWENEKAALDAFRAWETAVRSEGRVKLIKTNAYKDATGEPKTVLVSFWNNFVTIDSMTDSNSVKQEIDNVLAQLQQQGVNLEDPTLKIDIISRASQAPASVAPSSRDNTGKKRIDHDYNGLLKFDANGNVTPESKAAFDAKQKTDPQWGNKILAQKRGDAAANYIKSKGVKSKITITPEIHPTERSFIITAKVAGKEKYVAPLNLPDMQIKMVLKAEWIVSGVSSMTQRRTALMPKFYYRVEWQTTGDKMSSQGGSIRTEEDNTSSLGDEGFSRWMKKREFAALAAGRPAQSYSREGNDRNPLQANKSGGYGDNVFGRAQSDAIRNYMLGTGHFGPKSINQVWIQLTNGASKLVAAATGFTFSQWFTSTSAALGVTGDVNVETTPSTGNSFYGRELTTDAEIKEAQAKVASTNISIEKTITLQELADAAVKGGISDVSVEISKAPNFWTGAAWYDATVTPPTYGISLKENPNFFADATFNTTPINK